MHKVFGIRHHGPGSAKNVMRALDEFQPDCILIEAPADAEKLIPFSAHKKMKLPLAILIYNPADFNQAAFYPFASFSPEWQALQYGHKHQIELVFRDLPRSQSLLLPEENEYSNDLDITDPLGNLARIAGFKDSERWWDFTFEYAESGMEIFALIEDMVTALREEIIDQERETLLREAYVRNQIRNAIKNKYDRIAVICGAWHVPALNDLSAFKLKEDRALLKGLPKIKTDATWIPWTYDRLAIKSGYRAGVLSPAWYQLLFHQPEEVVLHWMSTVAQLFRAEDMEASAAHVIEAVRLANALATLRERAVPGIDELWESAVAIFCGGYGTKMDLIANKLIIGQRIGTVPPGIPQIPLQKDLEKTISSLRMSKLWQNPEPAEKELDLRKGNQALISQLLHRMNLLQILWGQRLKVSKGSSAGAFHEKWRLKWMPDFILPIIEAGMWGNTVEVAAANKIRDKVEKTHELPALTELIESAFNARLDTIFPTLIERLQDVSVLTQDITELMDALPALINTFRYGSTRGIDLSALRQVIEQLIPRVCIALPNTCLGMEEEASRDLFEKIQALNHAMGLLNDDSLWQIWLDALRTTAELQAVNGLIKGAGTRLLFDREQYNLDDTATRMLYALSDANDRTDAALWLEGFLYGSGLLLVHNPRLWNILDSWVEGIEMLQFKSLIPLLRRTFSEFSHPERQKMLEMARKGAVVAPEVQDQTLLVAKRAELVFPTLQLILGKSLSGQ